MYDASGNKHTSCLQGKGVEGERESTPFCWSPLPCLPLLSPDWIAAAKNCCELNKGSGAKGGTSFEGGRRNVPTAAKKRVT